MPKPMVATFIGGPWDLHRVALPDAPPTYEVAEYRRQRPITFGSSTEPREHVDFKTRKYRRHNLYNEQGDVLVYLIDDKYD